MPLSDQDVTSVMDWLGRTQPVGQQQLSLTTATGGAPSGGPVTPGGGLVAPVEAGPSPAPSGTWIKAGGGASPITQAASVADLVRKAAGLIPKTSGTADEPLGPGGAPAIPGELGPAGGEALPAGEALGPGGAPAIPGELGPAGEGVTGSAASDLPGIGQALGFASSLTGAITAQQDWQKAVHALDALLFASGVGAPVAAVDEAVLGVLNLFGLGGGRHTKGSTIHLPGVSPEGVTTHTAGGTATAYKSYGEGVQAANAFIPGLSNVKNLDELAALLNQNPQPGRFNIVSNSGRGIPTEVFSNRTQEGEPQFTAASLQNPQVLQDLAVQAGMMGAPADRPDIASAIREVATALAAPQVAPAEAASPAETAAAAAGPGMAGEGPAGALGFSRELLQAA